MIRVLVAVLFSCVTSWASVLHADNAVTFSLPQTPISSVGFIDGPSGFDFIPSTNISVDSLGFYDHDGDGFTGTHQIGIFDTLGETLVSSSVFVNSASTLDPTNNFRFESIEAFTLQAGTQYSLVSFDTGPVFDDYIRGPVGGVTLSPDLTFVRDINGGSADFGFPPTSAFGTGTINDTLFGPNFTFNAVPEPSMTIPLLVCTLMVTMKRRPRQRLA